MLSVIPLHPIRFFFGGRDLDHPAVIAAQQIAVTQDGAAHREYGDFFARLQRRPQTTFFALIVRQDELAVDPVALICFGIESQHEGSA